MKEEIISIETVVSKMLIEKILDLELLKKQLMI